MVSIEIFDLQKVGQCHEIQRRRMRHWIAFYGLQHAEKHERFISSRFPLVHQCDRRSHTDTRKHGRVEDK